MYYFIELGRNNFNDFILDMFIYPEQLNRTGVFEVDKELFYDLFEKRKTCDVILKNDNTEDCIRNRDFEFLEFDNIKRMKQDIQNEFDMIIKEFISDYLIIDGYNFIMSNNVLTSHGFFITEQNREEKYLEILAAPDNDVLLDHLDRYLQAMDLLGRYNNNMIEYRYFVDELKLAKTKEELLDIRERFLRRFC